MNGYRPLALSIGGQWEKETAETLPVINPATGGELGRLPVATEDHVDRAVAAAAEAFAVWRDAPHGHRRAVLRRAATLFRERSDDIARRLTMEQGKPIAQARAEVVRVAELFEWFGDETARLYGRTYMPRPDGVRQELVPEPLGVVAAFTAWNFPAVLAGRKLAMALAAGCTVVLKAAEESPASAMALVEALHDAGLPAGGVNLLFGRPAEIAARLIAAPDVRKVSLTGSVPVGKELARHAAAGVKPCSLELGGHCPVLVFPDADVERAAELLVAAKFNNAGQICTSPSRIFVHADVHDRFVAAFVAGVERLKVGDGLDPSTTMGPLAHGRRLAAIERYVDDARARGASVVRGGERLAGAGLFYAPTVIVDVPDDASLMREEYFGPIAPIVRFAEEKEAVARANGLPFGLAAYVFTGSHATADRMARALAAGGVLINTTVTVTEYTAFCGVKESGYGYEGGREGLDTYLHYKLVNRGEL